MNGWWKWWGSVGGGISPSVRCGKEWVPFTGVELCRDLWYPDLTTSCISFHRCIYWKIVMICVVVELSPGYYGYVTVMYNCGPNSRRGLAAWYAFRSWLILTSWLVLVVRCRTIMWRSFWYMCRSTRIVEIFNVRRRAYLRYLSVGLSDVVYTVFGGKGGVHLSYLTWIDSVKCGVLMVAFNTDMELLVSMRWYSVECVRFGV